MRVHIGTSGWQYAEWRGRFYPKGVPQRSWLSYYAERFACVEVNNTFYNLPGEETFQHWHDAVPRDFEFVLKASRYLTHVRRLHDAQDPARLFMERARPVRRQLGAVLLQLPPRFHADPERLRQALRAFPGSVRLAVEFRDPSWFSDAVRAVLEEHGAALCRADRRGTVAEPDWRTADWLYVRCHEGDGTPAPCYRASTLEAWAERLAGASAAMTDAYVFFNNDTLACAVRDAATLAEACALRGLDVTRAPVPGDLQPAGEG